MCKSCEVKADRREHYLQGVARGVRLVHGDEGTYEEIERPFVDAAALAYDAKDTEYGYVCTCALDGEEVQIPVISTGILALDEALGVGGLPRGCVVEVFGPGALTEIAMRLVAEAQRAGGTCAFIDAEHDFDVERAKRFGIRLEDLLVSQPDCGEQGLQGLEIADILVRTGAVDLIIVDSAGALAPRAEIDGELSESYLGLQARLMSQAMRKLTTVAFRTGTVVVFINRHRGQAEGSCSNALKFYSSVRLSVGPVGDGKVKVKVVKNKVAPPFREAEFEMGCSAAEVQS